MLSVFLAAALTVLIPVRVGYEENYPLSFTDDHGDPSGLYIELFREIAQIEGWEPEYVHEVWPRLTEMLSAGDIDLIACMTRTAQREQNFLFPKETVEAGWSILLVKKGGDIPTLRDLNGRTVALIEKDFHSETLMELIANLDLTVDTLWCSSYQEGIEAVQSGAAAAVPVPKIIMLSPDFPDDLAPQGIVWSPMAASFAGNRENSTEFINAINRNLEQMKADSSSIYYALTDKWLSEPERKSVPGEFYLLLGVLLFSLVAVILIINRKLAREVVSNRNALNNSRSLVEIALAAAEADSLDELYRTVAELLRKNLKADNFYLAIHNPDNGTFTFPFIKDEKDERTVLDDPESFTAYVFNTGKPLKLSRNEIMEMIRDPDIPVYAREDEVPNQYIAVPMQAGETCMGVIAFQSYTEERFTENDVLFVTGISGHLAGAFFRMRAREDLIRTRNRQKMLLDFDPTAIFLLDESGRIQDCNRQAVEFTGIPEEKLQGRILSEFLIDSDRVPLDPLRKHRPQAPSHFSCSLISENGSIYAVEGMINSFRDQDKLFHFVTIMDVTEKSLLERDAMRNERLEAIGLLAGGIAHDFNNILTGVMGSLSLLRTAETPEQSKKLLDSAEKAAVRARSLTGQLLTFAKGGAPVRKSVNTEAMLRDVTEFVLRGSSVLLNLHVAKGTWNLNVDTQQFSQVLQNIVTNARQAMDDHGIFNVRAANCETPRGRLVLIEFEDTGPGIPQDIIERIFDPYFTTKSEGHGLGLATSFSIMQKHDGTIKAGNGISGGALFSLLVPASSVKAGGQSRPHQPAGQRHSGRILILDDDSSVIETAGTMLEKLGYTHDTASNGQQAVEMYRESFNAGTPYTAVIMDLTIPGGFGGAEAVKLVLKIDPEAVVIVSSGYAGNDVMSNYAGYGFSGVLTKPYTIDELSSSLLNALQR